MFFLIKNQNLKSFKFLLARLAVWFFVCVTVAPVSLPFKAKAQEPGGSYVIKLHTNQDFNILSRVGRNIVHRFNQSADPAFANIFTFETDYSIEVLNINLHDRYDYLEKQRVLVQAGVVVNDPGFDTNGQNIDKEWALIKAGFDTAWQQTTGSKNNIVAVIDTGIDETHEDLLAVNFVPGFDFLSRQAIVPGVNSDDNGHGTLVSGVLGATANNGRGMVGTNWQISLMPIKALDAAGKGEAAAVAEAVVWATDHGAQFINLSIGGIGFGHDTTMANAVSYAFNHNVLLVAAAGNDVATVGGSLDLNPVFPICDDNNFNMVVGVAATDQNDLKPEFSNYGKNCIDVSAPGKRILSTINVDPLSKQKSPNAYAYASGTSLAVPFVVGQAALIRALYPFATNVQIRDRIISSADSIDSLNLAQCGGASCRGLLGTGRINVPKSLQTAIAQNFTEGDLVRVQDTGAIYEIVGGQKRLVSPFVFNQLFFGRTLKNVNTSELAVLPDGPYVTPKDGTLVKFDKSPAVYIIKNGQKLPISFQVFKQRNLNFASVNTLSFSELNSWVTGNFLPPDEGTLVKSVSGKTVYWVVGQSLHPISRSFYLDRGLNIFPILNVNNNEINSYPKGEAYIS